VVGYPLMPVYMAKAGGFFFVVFGVTALMGALMQINPVWKYGPYDPSEVTAGSQPDWYMGIAEGLLRIMPGWETYLFGFTLSWNVLIPGVVAPGILFTVVLLYPFLEQWVTGDKREHHLLERPRNAPSRTAFIVSLMTIYGLLWAAGGNDILAEQFHLNLNAITWFMRVAVFVGPVIAFIVTKRICLALQRSDRELLLHGTETGVIMRLPHGEYIEKHAPLGQDEAWRLASHERREVLPPPVAEDEHGVVNPASRKERLRAKLSRMWYSHDVQKPTRQELEEAHAHSDGHGPHELEGAHGESDELTPRH
jgi:ubiquinol-cytochrome c reductase cytochrome b subunit